MKISTALLLNVLNSIFGNIKFRFGEGIAETFDKRHSVSESANSGFSYARLSCNGTLYGLLAIAFMSFLPYNSTFAQNITVGNGQTLTISTNTTYSTLTVNNGGKLIILAPATLTVGVSGNAANTQVVDFRNGSIVNINSDAFMVVYGKLNNSNNSNNVTIDGDLYVNGNYEGGQGSAVIGNGTFNTSGSMSTANNGTQGLIFGSPSDCSSGPCDGNNLCGRTATATASNTSVCSGTTLILKGAISSGASPSYQWQSSATSNGTYANIGSSSTNSTYSFIPVASRYYRVLVSVSGCVTTSSKVYVELNTTSTAPTAITGPTAICSGTSAVLAATGGTLGTGASTVWYEGTTCGGFTQDFVTQPYTLNETTVNSVDGILNVTTSPSPALGDPMIFMNNVGSFNPTTYKYINIRYRVNSGNAGVVELFFINNTYANATAGISVVGSLISDGNWNVITLDMSSHPNWTTGGNIKGWRFDYCNNTSVNMDIDYISLTASAPIYSGSVSPSTTKSYISRYEGVCNTTTCSPTPKSITVNPTPTITSVTPGSRCNSGNLGLAAAASAGTINWYTVSANGTSIATGPSYNPTITSTTTYYVDATVAATGCKTPTRTAVLATVNPIPTITSVTPASRCGAGGVALEATASAGTVNWYTVSTNGSSVATGESYNPTVSSTTTYYVDATVAATGCKTPTRTAVVATLNPVPTVFVDNAAAAICSGASVTLKASGDPGKTLSFTGNEYIQLNNDPLASATSFTFEAMIYWTDNSTQWQRFFDFGNNQNVNMFFTPRSSSGYARYAITTTGSGGEQQINTTTTITTNTWHHVAITYNAATTTGVMYLNGVAIGTNTAMTMDPTDLTPKPLAFNYFGKSQYGVDPNFAGQMDEIRIWDIARTSIQLNANKGISVDPNSEDLVAYYKLNEGSGNQLTSVSGGGTATVSGTPSWTASTAPVAAPAGLTTTYAWSPSTGLNTASGATVIASPTSNQTYTVTATYNNSCSSTATSVITVNTVPTITSTTGATRCGTGSVSLSAASAGTIKWYAALTGGTALATGANYGPTVSTTTTYYVDATSSAGCISTPRIAVVATVNTAPVIGTHPSTSAQTLCASATATALSVSATGTGLTYQWYSNASNSNSGGTSISGATLASYTPVLSGARYYYVIVSGTCIPTATSNVSGLITINTAPVVTGHPSTSARTVCTSSPALTVTASGTGLTYQWYWNATNLNSGGTAISGATLASYTPVLAGARYYYCIVSGTCSPEAASNVSGLINIFTAPTIGTQPSTSAQTVCASAGATALSVAVTGASLTYQWYWNAGNSNSGGTSISGATLASYTPVLTGARYYYCIISGTCSPAATSDVSGLITINTAPVIGTHPSTSTQTLCAPASATAISVSATGTGLTYQWYSNGSNSNSGGTSISGATLATYTPAVAGARYYYAIVSGTCSPAATSAVSGLITINTAPSIGTQPSTATQTLCAPAAATAISIAATGTGLTYQWYSNVSNSNSGGTLISGATLASYAADITGAQYYYCVVSGTCSPAATSNVSGLITINIPPTIISTVSAVRCGPGTVTLGATASAGTVNWYTVSSGSSSIATGTSYTTGNIPSTINLYVDATNNGCTTATRTAVEVKIDDCILVWTGSSSSDWNTASNWSKGSVPLSSDTILIPNGAPNYPIITTAISTNKITITGAAKFDIASTGTLSAYGNITNSGTFTTVAGSTLAFAGAAAQTITGVPVLHNVTMNKSSDSVALNSAVTVKGTITLTKGVLKTNSNLTINFDAGGNIGYNVSDAGKISGIVSGRRDVNYKTHYLCSPFNGSTSAQIGATTPIWVSPYWKMYSRNFATQNWTAVTNLTTPMPLGVGFTVSFVSPAPLILSGTYDHTFTLTTPAYSNAAIDKYLMVGNPYPSTIDWESAGITKTNVQGAIYYWDGVNNRSGVYVSNIGINGATQFIPAMQSVMVATTGTGGSSGIVITNAARTSLANPGYLRLASEDVLRVKLEPVDPAQSDETVIRFNEMATSGFDSDLDANKILNTGTIPSVYTMSGLTKYAINSYTAADSAKVIPLYTKLPSDGTYTLRISTSNADLNYVLVDKQLGLEQSITESYTYSGLKADNADRFELQMRQTVTTGVHSATASAGLSITSSLSGFVINTDRFAGEVAEIEIMDIAGKRLGVLFYNTLVKGANFIPSDLAAGVYLVKVNVSSGSFASTVVLVK